MTMPLIPRDDSESGAMGAIIKALHAESVSLRPSGASFRPTRGTGLLESIASSSRAQAVLRALNPALREDNALDIGCGAFPYFLVHSRFRGKVGLDQIPSALSPEAAERLGINMVRLSLAGRVRLPFPDASFGCVTSLACIEHLDPESLPYLMAEIHRVLRPHGQMLLTTPHARADGLLRLLAACGLISREEIEEHQSLFRRRDLLKLLSQGRFPAEKTRVRTFQFGMNILAVAEK